MRVSFDCDLLEMYPETSADEAVLMRFRDFTVKKTVESHDYFHFEVEEETLNVSELKAVLRVQYI